MFIKVVVILSLLITLLKPTIISSKRLNRCIDPSETELKSILSEAYKTNLIDELSKGVDNYSSYSSKTLTKKSASKISYGKNKGNSACNLSDQTEWPMNHNTLCPHHFVEERRTNRYPFTIQQAVCNCDQCLGLPSTFLKYTCQPVSIYRPVLVRGQCQQNRSYEWTLESEAVAISCACNISVKFS